MRPPTTRSPSPTTDPTALPSITPTCRALSIRGRASVEIVDGVLEEYLAAARSTMDAEAAAEFEQHVRGMYDQMARIAITPRWVRFYDFGAGRMPRFLQELAEQHQS